MSFRLPFSLRRLCATLLLLSLPLSSYAADVDALRECVVPAQAVPLNGTASIGSVEDFGNVTVMELSGAYDRGLAEPREEVANAFYAAHPDQYDFLVTFTTFEFPTGIAVAFYNSLRNDTDGLGQTKFDLSSYFGSNGKLQGYVDMAAMSRYAFQPTNPQFEFALGVLSHELMHRWGVLVHFKDAQGNDSTDLIGQDQVHWSYFVDTDASVMLGAKWQQQADGKFHAVDIRHRYSPLDLYLAGFAAPNEVPPFTIIRNGDGNAVDLPRLGAVSGGQAESVTIDQVIAATGVRVPGAAQAQKEFTAAFILLKRPGENVSADTLYELENFRVRFQQHFAQMTNGRGLVRIYTQGIGAAVGQPAVLAGSGATQNPGGVSGAVAWLERQQRADGHWEDRAASAQRDTATVLGTLAELDPNFSGLARARAWLVANDPANLDQRAWRLHALRGSADASALTGAQDAHGGFALSAGWNDSAYDTSLVAGALRDYDIGSAAAANAQVAIDAAQNADGSFPFGAGGRGRVLPTLRAANLLNGSAAQGGVMQRLANWVSTQLASDGLVGGDGQHGSLGDTIETFAAMPLLAPDPQFADEVRQGVFQNQQVQGDWAGSVYLTARAALAYAHDQRANLSVDGALAIVPAQPRDGDLVRLGATVLNNGSVPSPANAARWYDGDPEQGGVQIGADVLVPPLPALSRVAITQTWDTTGQAGAHTLWLLLDAANQVAETSKSDNRASVAVSVQAPSDQPDLTVAANDFTLTPAAFSTLPSTEHLSGVLHNVGSTGVTGAVVRLYAMGDLNHALAETALDVAGRTSAPFALDFEVTQAATLTLLVRVDPDNAVAEATETNNETTLLLPFGQSLDLEIKPADLVLVEASPTSGQNVDFDVTVHNRGTVDSPPAVLHADAVQGSSTSAIFDAPVQVAAGQSITRRMAWRATQSGPSELRVSIDGANQVAETHEDNNNAVLDFTVAPPNGADLTFVQNTLAFVPSPAFQGQVLNASAIVRNLSSVGTGAFRVGLYAADPRSGATPIGSTVVPGVAGSSDIQVAIAVNDLDLSGDQTLYLFIDADNAIAETDETNNVVIAPLHVASLPDVAVSVADLRLTPALPVPGQSVQAQVTVRNLGAQDAHDVVVRLFEGDANTGAVVNPDQTLGTIAAGGSTVVSWNWTLGQVPNAHTVTAIADPGNTVREGSESNNVATLPFDVQNGDFFANQRYISPNGDGVQDETAIVFVAANAGLAELDVVNGAQYVVRHFADVTLNDALRGQVIWDGRDDLGRIVPDGDYHLVAIDAARHVTNGPLVTVDNNRSSVFEAWDSPYGVFTDFLHDNFGNAMSNVQIPPAGSPMHAQLFGFWRQQLLQGPAPQLYGIYRTETAFPDGVPVLDADWLSNYRQVQNLTDVHFDQFAFSPDGTQIVAGIFGNGSNGGRFGIVTSAVDQIDAGRTHVVLQGVYGLDVLKFLDNDTVLFGPDGQGKFQLLTLSTETVTPWRDGSNLLIAAETASHFGVVAQQFDPFTGASSNFYLPRDPLQAPIALNSLSALPYPPDSDAGAEEGADYAFAVDLPPERDVVAVYERNGASEKLDLIDLASGQRRTLLQATPALATGERTGRQFSVGRYAFGWLESQGELLVQDAVTRQAIVFSRAGNQLAQYTLPKDQRVGAYSIVPVVLGDPDQIPVPAPESDVFPSIAPTSPASAWKLNQSDDRGPGADRWLEQHVYDGSRDALYVDFGELIAHEEKPEGYTFFFQQGIEDLFRVDLDSANYATLQQGSFTQLIESADYNRYPPITAGVDTPPGDYPSLIMRDGARLRFDETVQTLSRGVLRKPWTSEINGIWPDEGRLLSRGGTFNSLLNGTAVLKARTVGRGIELSGAATDRNFAYYQLDYARLEQNPKPSDWIPLTTPSSDENFGDEFLTWEPPQPGSYLIRLTVVDKAGNRATATASAATFASASIDGVSIGPKFISPNGDGVQDAAAATYRVLAAHTLNIHIDDANGNTVRAVSLTYGSATSVQQEFDWDGRDDAGQVVPDGRYRIYLDDISAWVTVDNTPPTIVDVAFAQPYGKITPNCGSSPPPEMDCGAMAADVSAVRAAGDDVNLAFPGAVVEFAPKTSDDWQTMMVAPPSGFGSYRYRAVAHDRAGNSTTMLIGTGEETLILTAAQLPPSSVQHNQSIRYQPPPLNVPLDPSSVQPPIQALEIDQTDQQRLGFSDESGQLVRIAAETAPLAVPDQWTERGSVARADTCVPSSGGCVVTMDTRPLAAGAHLLVRLRGDRSDGSHLYSNQGYIVIGGVDPPSCYQLVGMVETVRAEDHHDGGLQAAKLLGPGGNVLASVPPGPGLQHLGWTISYGAANSAYVSGIDRHGFERHSPLGDIKCAAPSGGDGELATQLLMRPYPVVTHDQCDGQASDQVALGLREIAVSDATTSIDPREKGFSIVAPAQVKLSYTDALSGASRVLYQDTIAGPFPAQRFAFSTAGWPEGSYTGTLEVTDARNLTQVATVQIPVLKHAPTIDIVRPLSGSRVCANGGSGPLYALPLDLDITSPAENGRQVELGTGAMPASFQCVYGQGAKLPSDDSCGSLLQTKDLVGSNLYAEDAKTQPVLTANLAPFNGIVTMRLRDVGWSGGSVCKNTTFYLDSDVEFVQRAEPTTVIPISNSEELGISPIGFPDFGQATLFFDALEPVQVTMTATGPWPADTKYTLRQLAPGAQGNVDIGWNGVIQGAQAADGQYRIEVTASDGCNFLKTLAYTARLDATPPTVRFTAPNGGVATAASVIEFNGRVEDNYYLKRWSLDFNTGDGNWQNIASGDSPVAPETPGGLLGTWSRGSLTGSVDVRLSALDMLGNRSETHLSLTLLAPAKMIGGAVLQPPLFSPNGDGTLDVTRLQLGLLQNASLHIVANGAALFSGSGVPGTATFAWNGKDGSGQALADGDYPIVVDATDPNGVASPETATLTATIDNTPPALSITQPTTPFVGPTASVQVHTQDLHFASYDLSLTRNADGVVVSSAHGTQGGDVTLTALQGFTEGDYALHAVARDGAGNASTHDAVFTLDTTAPTVVLSSPLDGALLAAATATSVRGSVSDAHLATWTLSVAPKDADTWADLAHGSANLAQGEILAWTPHLPDGSYRLRLRGTDQAGNTSDVIHAIEIDGTPPVAKITAPANGSPVRAAFDVEGSANDAHFQSYRLSVIAAANLAGDQWSDVYIGTTPVVDAKLAGLAIGLGDGDYVLRLTVTDKVGLSATDRVTLHVDITPPPAPLNLIGHVANGNRDVVLDWNAVSAGDLAGYHVYRGGARVTATPVPSIHYVDAGAPEGHLTYYVTAIDLADNESAPSNTLAFYIDHTPPAVAIVRPQPAERIRGAYPIVGTAYSHDDFKQYRLSVLPLDPAGPTLSLASSSLPAQAQTLASWDTSTQPEGASVRIHLEAEDTSGNIASADVDVTIDNLPPAAPTGLTALLSGLDVQANWNPNAEPDLLGYLLYRDGSLVTAGGATSLPADLRPYAIAPNSYLDPAVPDGTHTYVVYAVDRAGNVSPPSAPATLSPLDNHPPSMTIVQPSNGTRFDSSIIVFATSSDSDIAQVQFAWRAQGSGGWSNFGGVLTNPPYRVVWTPPQGTPYGDYEIRALATDLGGRSDPSPPSVAVVYADLIPPDAPVNVHARADADTVHVTWNASTASDIAGYRVMRGYYVASGSTLVTGTSFDDPGLVDADYEYTVIAIDKFGNASDSSANALAHVFSVNLVPPYSPVSSATTKLNGSSAQPGSIALHDDSDQGASDSSGATAGDGSIALDAIALGLGSNHFTVRVTDANGDISRPAQVWVDRGNVPTPPSHVVATVADHDVGVTWNANIEPDLLGYRVFRNDHVLAGDVPLGETPTAVGVDTCSNAASLVDGDAQTYCEGYAFGNGEGTTAAGDRAIELDWTQPRIVTAARLGWVANYVAVSNLDVFAWSGHAWIRVARVRGNTSADQSIAFDHPYRTTQLRFVLRSPDAGDVAQYYQLAEARLLERPVQSATSVEESALIDGDYNYTVTAVSAFAFESVPSSPAEASVGDTQGGGAVELIGSLVGADATLSWTASPAPNVARYDLLRNGKVIDSIDAAAPRSWLDAGLSNGSYAYVVYAYDALGNASAPSNTVTLTVSGFGPGVPVGLTVTDARTGGELDEQWQPGGGTPAVAFILRRGGSADGPFDVVAQIPGTKYFDSGLANGSTYYYTVEAVDAENRTSGQSVPVSGTPSDHLPPSAPLLTYPTSPFGAVVLHATQSAVCGMADPGTTVELDRAGSLLGTAAVLVDTVQANFDFNGATVLPAPDGRSVAEIESNAIRIMRLDSGVFSQQVPYAARLPLWAMRGMTLYFADATSDVLYRWEIGQTPAPLAQPVTGVTAFAVAPDESTLAVAGQYDANGAGVVGGVWLLPVSGGAPRRLGTFDGATQLVWSPNGRHVLVLPGDGSVAVIDSVTGDSQTLDRPNAVVPTFSADGRELAYARNNAQGESDVIVRTVATQAERLLRAAVAGLNALAWSPGNDAIALAYASQVDLVLVDGSFVEYSQSAFANQSLTWTASGRVIVYAYGSGSSIDPAGSFCVQDVPLAVGANILTAAAIEPANLRSVDSAPIEIDTPANGLPDLAIGPTDILFLPSSGTLGQDFSALVVLRNRGTVDVGAPTLHASLTAPDGTLQVLPTPPLAALPAGAAEQVSFALGTLTQPGSYRFEAIADPQQALRESDESNNDANATLTISVDGKPALELNLARSVFAPDEVVTGDVAVTNPGATFSGKVNLRVLDAGGAAVADLGEIAIAQLAFGERFDAPVRWNAQGVFAGTYQLRAELAAVDDSAVAQRTAAFSIGTVRHVQLALNSDAPTYAPGDTVSLHTAVAYSDGNAPLGGASLRLTALDASGNALWQSQQALGTLLPGYVLGRDDAWPTGAAAAGVYTLRLELQSPDLMQSTEASVTLVAAAPTRALSGSIAFDPGTTLIAGGDVVVDYQVHNAGTAALSGVQARLRIVTDALAPVTEQNAQYDLATGGTHAASLTLQAPPLALISHLAVLEARLPEDPSGQWRLLAQQGFAVIDALPPVIGVLSPDTNHIQPAVVPFRASILDQHSVVTAAEVSVDGGNWQPVSVGVDGYYARGLTGLADGDHSLVVRARDTWNNVAQSPALPFTVDATPPLIVIANVTDGQVSNQPLTPNVTISDAHPDKSDVRLNGAPFVSGTTVSADGSYVLTARASDTATNQSLRSVRFTIDRTAPSVAIVAPADGATVAQSSIHVDVQTEAQASVTLTTGAFQSTAAADTQGHAGFDGVPLALGANSLSATAIDRAGNNGGPATITVTYDASAVTPLTGSIQPSTTTLAYGSPLGVALRARNPNAAPLAAQALRVRVFDAANAVLATQSLTHDFAANETYDTNLAFDSTGWALGAITLVLELDESGTWTALDAKNASVVDLTPPLLALSAPAQGEILHGPVTIGASASDTLSGIVSVEASVDGGDWSALAAAGPGAYASPTPLALADGDHAVSLRAHDGAGNLANAGPGQFTIDSVPPLIQIAGVAEGDQLDHAVAPAVTISDLHPGTSDVRLNGQPFVSGTSIVSSGDYTLAASASDAAGNSSSMSVHFTLDLDPPFVTFTAPAANAVVTSASVDVTGHTEAQAHVHLWIGGFSVDTDAAADGTFDVAGVPLMAGANTISARATDRAGNLGPTATLNVTYQVAALTGTLDSVPLQLARGLPLDLPYTLHNAGNVPFAGLPLRIELAPAAGGGAVASDDFSRDIDAGTDAGGSREIATGVIAPGNYMVLLRANLPASPGPGGWITLDTKTTTLILDPCRGKSSDRIFGDGFEGGTASGGDEIFCNGFEELLAAAAIVLHGDLRGISDAFWAAGADALPALRALGPRLRFELVAARALSGAKARATSVDPPRPAKSPRFGRARLADSPTPWPSRAAVAGPQP